MLIWLLRNNMLIPHVCKHPQVMIALHICTAVQRVSERKGHPSGALSSGSWQWKLRPHNQLAKFWNLNHPHIFLSVVNFLSWMILTASKLPPSSCVFPFWLSTYKLLWRCIQKLHCENSHTQWWMFGDQVTDQSDAHVFPVPIHNTASIHSFFE